MLKRSFLYRLISIGVGVVFLFVMATGVLAQDDAAEETATEETAAAEVEEAAVTYTDVELVQYNLDMTWMLTAGFLVFFMQAGFAMLEGGFIRHTGVVNSMAENFMDACITAIVFFLVGFSIAYAGGDGAFIPPAISFGIGTDLTLAGADIPVGGLDPYADFFFQFAFAGAAATIATGAMAERTDFRGKMIYSAILGALIYPIVVFWSNWNGGFLGAAGMVDFAGSTIVHQTGGVIALVGAAIVGPRVGRVFGSPPGPSNLMLASLGTFVLWFGWYGFNVGSTLAASDVHLMGLVAVNTTLAAAASALSAMFFVYIRKGKWDMGFILNGSLAGLVGITAGCAFVSPVAALIIGLTAGIVVVLSVDAVEIAKIDDAVGAFAVHGACGMLGTLAIGFWGAPELLGEGANYGLFLGGGFALLGSQLYAVVVVTIWAAVTGIIMFGALNAMGLLRMSSEADEIGIDAHEHDASLYGDILVTLPNPEPAE